MKFVHNIKYKDAEIWKEWVAKHIGVKGIDYFQELGPITIEEIEGGGSIEHREAYWVIPDSKKALLWALRWA